MYLLKVLNGKETLIANILRKYSIPTKRGAEKGLLFTDTKVPMDILDELRGYVIGVTELDDQETQPLINPPPKKSEKTFKAGDLVEIISGSYTGFRGIIREIKGESVVLDIFLFGQASFAEVSIYEITPYKVDMLVD